MVTERYNALIDLMTDRFSCRHYDTERKLDRSDIEKVLEAARIAPSACNRQPWQFLVIDDEKGRDAIISAYNRDWIAEAPAYIIALGNHDEAWHRADGKDHTDVDISIAVEHICLAATALGLATCWVCNFDAPKISQAFSLPDHIEPIVIIPIGYAAEQLARPKKSRKDAEQIIKWGSY